MPNRASCWGADAGRRAPRPTLRVQVGAVDGQPSRPHRGRDGDGQDQDAPAPRRSAVRRRRAGLRGRRQGRPDRPRGTRRRGQPQDPGTRAVDGLDVPAARPPGRVPVAVRRAGRPGPGQRPLVRAAAAGQGPRPQRDADLGALAGLQVLRRQGPAAARPGRPRDDAQVPRLGRGQADPRPTTAACPRPRWACSSGRSSRSSRRAPTCSSASPSSTSPT